MFREDTLLRDTLFTVLGRKKQKKKGKKKLTTSLLKSVGAIVVVVGETVIENKWKERNENKSDKEKDDNKRKFIGK